MSRIPRRRIRDWLGDLVAGFCIMLSPWVFLWAVELLAP